jgi:hypothetical protein
MCGLSDRPLGAAPRATEQQQHQEQKQTGHEGQADAGVAPPLVLAAAGRTAMTASAAAIAIPTESCLSVCCLPNMESSSARDRSARSLVAD